MCSVPVVGVCVPFMLLARFVLRTGAGEKKKRRMGADYSPLNDSKKFDR